jgi:glycosyltransferase involved in cell wall biosynthesis
MSLDPVRGGGTAERTFQLSRFLTKTGIDCSILTTDLGLTEERLEALGRTRVVALPCWSERFYFPGLDLKRIQRLVEENDLIHIMGHWTVINALAYRAAVRATKPYVVCPAGALPIYGRSRLLKRFYNRAVGRQIIGWANGHIAITPTEIAQFELYGIPPEKIVVIPNGIDGEQCGYRDDAEFRRRYDLGANPFFLFVGRLNPIKGPDLLLKAFGELKEQLPDYHLVMAGPDEGMLASLLETAAALRIQHRVHFPGYLGQKEKSQAYHASAALVIPSRQEAMSLVVLEAGLAGTPVLITDQCGFDDVAAVSGGWIAQASVESLRSGLLAMAGHPENLEIKGQNLKRYVQENFLWDRMALRHLELFSALLP